MGDEAEAGEEGAVEERGGAGEDAEHQRSLVGCGSWLMAQQLA